MHSQPVHRQRSSNASLLVNSDAGSSTFTAPGLSLADSGGSTVQFDLNTASLPTAPLMNISGINGLNLNGDTHTLRVNNVQGFAIGTFHFVGPNGNPDLPNTTYITANPGGTALFTEGEDLGGINLNGGALQLNNAAFGLTGTTASSLQSGTITSLGGTSTVGGAAGFNKTTAGTVSITGVALNNAGAQAIDEGTLETDSGIGGAGVLSLGTASSSATLRLTGSSPQTYSKGITLNNTSVNGSRIDVSNASTLFTWSGTVSGAGQLTKAGAGTLVLGAAAGNTYAGGTTINEGTLVVNNTSGSGTGTGPVVINAGGALSVSGAISGSL
jgi:autotransporter-associated beta strand protein